SCRPLARTAAQRSRALLTVPDLDEVGGEVRPAHAPRPRADSGSRHRGRSDSGWSLHNDVVVAHDRRHDDVVVTAERDQQVGGKLLVTLHVTPLSTRYPSPLFIAGSTGFSQRNFCTACNQPSSVADSSWMSTPASA